MISFRRPLFHLALGGGLALLAVCPEVIARPWQLQGIAEPVEAEFVGAGNGFVVLRGENGTSTEVPLTAFTAADRDYIELREAARKNPPAAIEPGKPITRGSDYSAHSMARLTGRTISLGAASELHLTNESPFGDANVNFTAGDGWLFLEKVSASTAREKFLGHFLVNGVPADPETNLRIVRHGQGAVIVPHGPDFPAATIFRDPGLTGESQDLRSHENYGRDELAGGIGSFVLKRGYMATFAENEDGTGASRNYVAQDHDIVVEKMPAGLEKGVRFIRVFPWRWTTKKGIAGGIHQNLNVSWYYDWNIEGRSNPDLEYVAIKQKRHWPGLDQDWKWKGINHLLGYNEPDRPDQANMTVDEAIAGWPELLGTGLRLGSPAVSDGGLGWLYEFMDKADAQGLRVDFVAVHYYRAVGNPGDGRAAAAQFHDFLQGIHERVKRPLWVTEWNNGANWTTAPDPSYRDQQRAIKAMIEMLDKTPFVERYALYNWVEETRMLVRDDGSLTPAGEAYRDQASPVFFTQPKR